MTPTSTLSRILTLGTGALIGAGATAVVAAVDPPTEHKGLGVETLGVVPSGTVEATTGLEGYFLQLRTISIMPGGQIARHSHENRPGVVKMLDGEWVEGRASGERVLSAADEAGLIEDEATVHWFFNRGSEPATAVVCDLTPES